MSHRQHFVVGLSLVVVLVLT